MTGRSARRRRRSRHDTAACVCGGCGPRARSRRARAAERAGARRISHRRLPRGCSGDARRRTRPGDRGGRSDLARRHRRLSSTCCRVRQSRQIFPPARCGATSRGLTFPAASGCRTPVTASWRRRPRLTCGQGLERASGGNKAALLVIYCQEDCWMSWNAAKRVLSYGYPNVAWYPRGDRRMGARQPAGRSSAA